MNAQIGARWHLGWLLTTLLILGPTTLAAQEAPTSPEGEVAPQAQERRQRRGVIEEITVTARKREEALQDVPIAITAITTELEDSTIRNLADVAGYSPNVVIGEASGRPRGTAISIRGVSASEITDKSHDSPVAVALDGVFFGTFSGRNVENFDLERIEVLRGPQGTLFGKNTVGGVINIIRSKPTGEFGGKVRVTFGRYDQQEYRGLLNFPIGESLAAKLFFADISSDGWMDNPFTGQEGPEKDYRNFGVSLLWTPIDSFEAWLTLERYRDDTDLGVFSNWNIPAGTLPPPPPSALGAQDLSTGFLTCTVFGSCRTDLSETSRFETNTTNDGRYRNDALSLTMTYDLTSSLRLVSVTGYHDTPVEDYINELDGSNLEIIWIDNDNEYDQFTQELRLEGTWDAFDYVAGAYYLDSSYEQDWVTLGSFWQLVLGPFNPPAGGGNLFLDTNATGNTDLCVLGVFAPLFCDTGVGLGSSGLGDNFVQKLYQDQDTESLAFFAQVDWAITDKLSVTAGIRYTDEEKKFKGAQAYLAPLARARVFNFQDFVTLKNDWQETTLRFGIDYRLSDDIMFYASYAEGFKSGGFFGRNQNISDFANNQYDPELAENWEIGMKGQFFDNRVRLNLSAFYNDFEDKQDSNVVLDPTTNTVATVWENIGGIDYTGWEAEMQWVVNSNLNVFATVGWLDAEYDGFLSSRFVPVDQQATTPKQNVDFLTPKNAPEWTFGAGGTFVVPIGPGDLGLHAKWNYIDDIETQTYNDPFTAVDARTFVNAQVSYTWNRIKITAFGDNLTDEVLEVPGTVVWPFVAWSTVSRGTTYGVELEVEF